MRAVDINPARESVAVVTLVRAHVRPVAYREIIHARRVSAVARLGREIDDDRRG